MNAGALNFDGILANIHETIIKQPVRRDYRR